MKRAKKVGADELRSEYQRSTFGALIRGKYTEQLKASSNAVVLDPEVAALFPNAIRNLPGIEARQKRSAKRER